MFTVRSNVTFILENNITLQGHTGNTGPLVIVEYGGSLKMRIGSTITGNTGGGSYGASGVLVTHGTFEMTGGTISNNTAREGGGGVFLSPLTGEVNFTMSGGSITGNTANVRFDWQGGGGVYIDQGGVFTMTGGIISGNISDGNGGGVNIYSSTFNMRGGTITGNTARKMGGGVYIDSYGNFTKTGGTITGYNSDPNNGNTVIDESNNVLARMGHAVYSVNGGHRRRETTAGPGINLSVTGRNNSSGAWD